MAWGRCPGPAHELRILQRAQPAAGARLVASRGTGYVCQSKVAARGPLSRFSKNGAQPWPCRGCTRVSPPSLVVGRGNALGGQRAPHSLAFWETARNKKRPGVGPQAPRYPTPRPRPPAGSKKSNSPRPARRLPGSASGGPGSSARFVDEGAAVRLAGRAGREPRARPARRTAAQAGCKSRKINMHRRAAFAAYTVKFRG